MNTGDRAVVREFDRWRRILLGGVALTVLCAVVYVMTGTGGRILSLDREVGMSDGEFSFPIPAVVSGATLLAGAWLWWRAGHVFRGGRAAVVFGGFLAFMSLDEVVGIHEQVGHLLHVKWLVAYIPVMAAAAVAALLLIRQLQRRGWMPPIGLLMGGACLWAFAQVLELLEWNGEHKVLHYYRPMMLTEEVCETLGSALFGLAAAWVLDRGRARIVPGRADEAPGRGRLHHRLRRA